MENEELKRIEGEIAIAQKTLDDIVNAQNNERVILEKLISDRAEFEKAQQDIVQKKNEYVAIVSMIDDKNKKIIELKSCEDSLNKTIESMDSDVKNTLELISTKGELQHQVKKEKENLKILQDEINSSDKSLASIRLKIKDLTDEFHDKFSIIHEHSKNILNSI